MDENNKHTPTAFCHRCRSWQPMAWRPIDKRGRRAETWFYCATCGHDKLTLRYLTPAELKEQQARMAAERHGQHAATIVTNALQGAQDAR